MSVPESQRYRLPSLWARLVFVGVFLVVFVWQVSSFGQINSQVPAGKTWSLPTGTDVSTAYEQWLTTLSISYERRSMLSDELVRRLHEGSNEPMLEEFIEAIVRARPDLSELVNEIAETREQIRPALRDQIDVFINDSFCERHLRLFALQQWVRAGLFEEALAISKGIEATDVVFPQVLLLNQAIAHHQLLQKTETLANIRRLLEHTDTLPKRYVALAELMGRDIERLEADSLDEIVRLMRDVERRTGLNRAGQQVLDQEADVIAKLDRLIKRLEEEQQQNQQSVAGQGGSPQNPLDDSRPVAGKGTGEVTKKNLSGGGNWGDLPPADKAATLAEMTRELPPHFRSIVEEYFKSLAKQRDEDR